MRLMGGYQSKDSASFQLIAPFDHLILRTYNADDFISKVKKKTKARFKSWLKLQNLDRSSSTSRRTKMIGQALVKWLSRTAAIALILPLIGLIYQAIATRLDERKYPPPGRLVDVGGYRLHIQGTESESHKNEPTVVLDAGLGDCSLTWSLVQPEIAKFASVYSYDRAGLSWSDPAPTLRTSKQMVRELHALLTNAGIKKPYVLVGHSGGGINALLFASQYPEDVAGIVLVDSAHEDQGFKVPLLYRVGPLTAPFGLPRLFSPLFLSAIPVFAKDSRYPPVYRAMVARTNHVLASRQEFLSVEQSLIEAGTEKKALGDLPLIVLTASHPYPTVSLSQAQAEGLLHHKTLQKELAQRSTSGKQIIVDNSSHFIQYDHPEVVIEAVRSVMDSVRRKRLNV
jgi:pimeloyl-ACP methyl ester carboxylesterase